MVCETAPMTRRQAFIALMVIGNIAWFGGLLRLVGEGAARLVSAIRPDAIDEATLIVAVLGVALFVGVFVVLWPWFEKFDRQTQADMAALYGVPVDKMPTLGAAVQRDWKGVVVVGGGAIVVALILPALVAAALAIAAGVVLRLVGIAIAGSASDSTSP